MFGYTKARVGSHGALGMIVLALSTGCAESGSMAESESGPGAGTWPEEIAQALDATDSAEVRDALADGAVSDREYAEMTARYEDCLSASGITLTSYEFDGSTYLPPASMDNDQANRVASECSERSGEYPLSYFYVQMRANPDHKDLGQAIVDCLKREGLVGSGYGLKDYRAGDLPAGDADAPVVATCSIDPHGLLGG